MIFNPRFLFQDQVWGNNSVWIKPVQATNTNNDFTDVNMLLAKGDVNSTYMASSYLQNNALFTAGFTGNVIGKQRLCGLSLRIRSLGTKLNEGGEVFIVVNPEMTQICNGPPMGSLIQHRSCVKLPLTNKGVCYNLYPRSLCELDFSDAPNYLNCYGGKSDNLPLTLAFGARSGTLNLNDSLGVCSVGYQPLGWNFAIIVNSAAPQQTIEVEADVMYEGEFRQQGDNASSTVLREPNDISHASAEHVAQVTRATAVKSLRGATAYVGGKLLDSVVKQCEAAAADVLPKLAAGIGSMLLAN